MDPNLITTPRREVRLGVGAGLALVTIAFALLKIAVELETIRKLMELHK